MTDDMKKETGEPRLKDTAVTPSERPGDGPLAGSGDLHDPKKVWLEGEGRAPTLTDRPGISGRVQAPGGMMDSDRSSQASPYSEEAQADAVAKQGDTDR